jgi:TPP-dependent pyruvate/acetoin dehydrogenase alpha subunit
MTAEELIAFEAEVAAAYNSGAIPFPVHLSGGNEAPLLRYFAERFRLGDWVVSTWRSHYHCLLAGVPPDEVMSAIRAGRSIALCFPEHRFLASAIVAGACPIAVGLAASGAVRHVHVFVGDMCARTGLFHECREYSVGHDLPITFIVEDNGLSVKTNTREVWGELAPEDIFHDLKVDKEFIIYPRIKTMRYVYTLDFPHSGAGIWVDF